MIFNARSWLFSIHLNQLVNCENTESQETECFLKPFIILIRGPKETSCKTHYATLVASVKSTNLVAKTFLFTH